MFVCVVLSSLSLFVNKQTHMCTKEGVGASEHVCECLDNLLCGLHSHTASSFSAFFFSFGLKCNFGFDSQGIVGIFFAAVVCKHQQLLNCILIPQRYPRVAAKACCVFQCICRTSCAPSNLARHHTYAFVFISKQAADSGPGLRTKPAKSKGTVQNPVLSS